MIIGLYSTVPQSGKTTFANMLSSMYGKEGYVVSFADILRELVVKVSAPFLHGGEQEAWEWLEDERKDKGVIPELGVTHRHMLQTIGTEWGRHLIHPDVWVKVLMKRIEDVYYFAKDYPLIVIDDVRFENEFDWIRSEGGVMVRIVRQDAPDNNAHMSHGLLDDRVFDYEVVANGIEALRREAKTVLYIEMRA